MSNCCPTYTSSVSKRLSSWGYANSCREYTLPSHREYAHPLLFSLFYQYWKRSIGNDSTLSLSVFQVAGCRFIKFHRIGSRSWGGRYYIVKFKNPGNRLLLLYSKAGFMKFFFILARDQKLLDLDRRLERKNFGKSRRYVSAFTRRLKSFFLSHWSQIMNFICLFFMIFEIIFIIGKISFLWTFFFLTFTYSDFHGLRSSFFFDKLPFWLNMQ